MKRIFSIMMITLALLLVCPISAANAVAKIDLAFDGVIVPTERTEENTTSFYLEARPQMRSNSVFVPVRVVSEILGADVAWTNPNMNIKFDETEISLSVGSRTAYKDGQKLTLPAAPYERGGYTYVPIRFVAEAFDCDVEWQAKRNLVNIKTKPWVLNGQEVVGAARCANMGTRLVTRQTDSPYFAGEIYQMALQQRGMEVSEPQNSSVIPEYFEGDTSACYMLDWIYYLLIDDDNAAATLEIYYLVRGEAEYKYLLKLDNKWYAITEQLKDDMWILFEQSGHYGFEEYKVYNCPTQD